MAEESTTDQTFDEGSSALQEIIVEAEENSTDSIIKTLKAILELKEGSSESLTHITTVINETYPGASAATVHECLVNAFPDLQAQQSNDQEEIYYLGIKLNNYITTEDRVVDWLKTRFKEDKYGSISVSTVSDIANKEIGFQRSSLIGTYLRKAFPEVYVRRSDRLRWYCGITLPEKVMTEEERQRVAWLEAACAWLRQNVKRHENGREKCSLIFAALIQYIGKVGVESCLAAVKCVFPSIQRKTFDRTAYYCDIQLREHVDRDEIQVTESKKTKADLRVLPPITEEEKEMVLWLRNTIQIMERHRERLSDIRCMMIAKLQEDISEKGCLKFLRKAFPAIVYRKREGVAYVGGVEIKEQFRPKEPWVEKAVEWVKKIIIECEEQHVEKYHPINIVLRKGLQTTNQSKINRVFNLAFPSTEIKKTHDGRIVNGVTLLPNYADVDLPVFTEEDFCGDFTDIDMNESQNEDEASASFNTTLDISGVSMVNRTSTSGMASNINVSDNMKLRQLCEKVDALNGLVTNMSKEIKVLHEQLDHSSRQKDSLIVQLQQALMLLTQQQYSKILNIRTGAGEEEEDVVEKCDETTTVVGEESVAAELVQNDADLLQ